MNYMSGIKVGEIIREIRMNKQMSQSQLARASNLSNEYISKIELGKVTNIGLETLGSIASALNVPLDSIIYGDEAPSIPQNKDKSVEFQKHFRFIPLLTGEVSAHLFTEALKEWHGEYLPISREIKNKNLVSWRIKAQSMEPSFFDNDCIVINLDYLDSDPDKLDDADIVAEINKGEIVLRNLKVFKDGTIELRSYNSKSKTIQLKNQKDLRIIGVVAGLHRDAIKRK